jgi:hypothetical protein
MAGFTSAMVSLRGDETRLQIGQRDGVWQPRLPRDHGEQNQSDLPATL